MKLGYVESTLTAAAYDQRKVHGKDKIFFVFLSSNKILARWLQTWLLDKILLRTR